MSHRLPHRVPAWAALVAALLVLALTPRPAHTGLPIGPTLDPADISWSTTAGVVHFSLRFRNLDPAASSEPVAGGVHAQEFGVFLPNQALLHSFNVPTIVPESFFDVFFEVPLCDLPGACGPPPPGAGAPAVPGICPPDDHWDGNVDVIWNGPFGPVHVNAHIGTAQVCPGMGRSYTHVVTNCPVPAPWVIAGVCPGWTVTLVNEDFTPAPNPVPPGWTGHICVAAGPNVPLGTVCCFTVTFTCQGVPGVINMCATACQCPVPIYRESWSSIKAVYR